MKKIDFKNLGLGFLGILLLLAGGLLVYVSEYYPSTYFVSFADNFPLVLFPYILIVLGLIFTLGGFATCIKDEKENEEPPIHSPPPPPS
jgi:uncharacterized membrane protein